MSHPRRVRRAALLFAVLAAAAPGSADASAPGPAVMVDDGVQQAVTGAELSYTVTVANHGPKDLDGLRVEQRLPSDFQSATSPGGKVDGGWIVWTVDVPAGDETTLRAAVRLSEDLPLGREAGTVVCVYLRGQGLPQDCDSETTELRATPRDRAAPPWNWVAAALAVAALAAAAARAVVVRPLYKGVHRRRGTSRRAALGAARRRVPG